MSETKGLFQDIATKKHARALCGIEGGLDLFLDTDLGLVGENIGLVRLLVSAGRGRPA